MPRQLQIQPGGAIVLPTACVDDEAADSSRPLGVTKTRHLFKRGTNFGQLVGDAPTTREMIVHYCAAAGTLRNFRALLEETGTNTLVEYDLKKYNAGNPNGVSVLSGVIAITHGTADRTAVAGTINAATTAAGDVIAILQTMTNNTGAAGPWAEVEVDESAV